jgi:hypothetical protein
MTIPTIIEAVCMSYALAYLATLVYGWRHQNDQFWQGFCDPLRLRERWRRRS